MVCWLVRARTQSTSGERERELEFSMNTPLGAHAGSPTCDLVVLSPNVSHCHINSSFFPERVSSLSHVVGWTKITATSLTSLIRGKMRNLHPQTDRHKQDLSQGVGPNPHPNPNPNPHPNPNPNPNPNATTTRLVLGSLYGNKYTVSVQYAYAYDTHVCPEWGHTCERMYRIFSLLFTFRILLLCCEIFFLVRSPFPGTG